MEESTAFAPEVGLWSTSTGAYMLGPMQGKEQQHHKVSQWHKFTLGQLLTAKNWKKKNIEWKDKQQNEQIEFILYF